MFYGVHFIHAVKHLLIEEGKKVWLYQREGILRRAVEGAELTGS
jgi:hypothetical protein